jgi:hypothetical protein
MIFSPPWLLPALNLRLIDGASPMSWPIFSAVLECHVLSVHSGCLWSLLFARVGAARLVVRIFIRLGCGCVWIFV